MDLCALHSVTSFCMRAYHCGRPIVIQFHHFHTWSPQIVEMQPGFWSPFSFPASATCLAVLHPLQPQTHVLLSWIHCHGTLCARALCKYMRAQHGDLQLAYRRRRKIQCICAKVHPIRMKSYELVMHEWVGDQQIFWLWHSPPKPWQYVHLAFFRIQYHLNSALSQFSVAYHCFHVAS